MDISDVSQESSGALDQSTTVAPLEPSLESAPPQTEPTTAPTSPPPAQKKDTLQSSAFQAVEAVVNGASDAPSPKIQGNQHVDHHHPSPQQPQPPPPPASSPVQEKQSTVESPVQHFVPPFLSALQSGSQSGGADVAVDAADGNVRMDVAPGRVPSPVLSTGKGLNEFLMRVQVVMVMVGVGVASMLDFNYRVLTQVVREYSYNATSSDISNRLDDMLFFTELSDDNSSGVVDSSASNFSDFDEVRETLVSKGFARYVDMLGDSGRCDSIYDAKNLTYAVRFSSCKCSLLEVVHT